MKRIFFSILAFLTFVLAAGVPQPPAFAQEFRKTKIAVLDFQLQGVKDDSSDMGKIVAEWLITAFVKEGRFDVIERRLLEKVVQEQKMGASGLVDESSASRLGKVLGAKVVITGSVLQFQNVMEVNARIIEVESSSIIAAENVKSTSAVNLENLVVEMAEKIIRDFPLEGYIVQREGNKVLVDLGKRAGVRPGMRFRVSREGRVIKHPKTGEVLDVERIETGTIEIVEVKTKTADGKILQETENQSVNTGQQVRSYTEFAAVPDRPGRDRSASESLAGEGRLDPQLAAVEAMIRELRQLKIDNNSAWKIKYREADHSLDILEKRHKRSPEVYLARARMLEAIDKLEHAEKYISKALSVRRHYPQAYALRGDIYVWNTMKPRPVYSRNKALKRALNGYEDAAKYAVDKDFQADMYLKMGNAYAELGNPDKAKFFWQRAADIAPSGRAAMSAREKLSL